MITSRGWKAAFFQPISLSSRLLEPSRVLKKNILNGNFNASSSMFENLKFWRTVGKASNDNLPYKNIYKYWK